jgi:hypothetical protein
MKEAGHFVCVGKKKILQHFGPEMLKETYQIGETNTKKDFS